uniref:G-protein coupled receptors family 1 profile domain-containing protein n=1 Tax=Mola mola TaxID=94237 RepID=A0A3Q3WWG2_MOLML
WISVKPCGRMGNGPGEKPIKSWRIQVFLLGPGGDLCSADYFITKWNTWTDTHVYMFNLAIADFALILFLPFRIYDVFICLSKTFLTCTFLISTHFINIAHRYLAISFPPAVTTCLALWGVVLTISAVFQEEKYPNRLWTCYERCKVRPLQLRFVFTLVFPGFLAPLLMAVFCTSWIICKCTTGTALANMIVFIVCYKPIHVGFLVNYSYSPPPVWQSGFLPAHVYVIVSEWIASTNCCFDSISYYFLTREFCLIKAYFVL